MKRVILLSWSAIFILCFSSCKTPFLDVFYNLLVSNNSPKKIRVYLADEYAEKQYPDTSLPYLRPTMRGISTGKQGYFDSQIPWENRLKKLPADTLSIFIIDDDVFQKVPWDSIRINYMILHRFDISIQDLADNNSWFYYP